MYAKIFASLYQGTLRGCADPILVFTNLLAHCDSAGVVDIHPRAISEEVGIDAARVEEALKVLESPDPDSRSPLEGGRRIIRLDEHRSWGWRVVNYGKYRAIRSEDDRREQNRLAQRAWRARQAENKDKLTVSKISQASAQSAQAEVEVEEEAVNLKSTPSVEISSVSDDSQINEKQIDSLPPCPQQEILNLFCQTLPTLRKPRIWDGARAEALRSRWRYCAKGNGAFAGYSTQAEGLAFWKRYFEYIAKSRKLTEGIARPDGSMWKPDLPWLLKAENFSKVIERKFHD